MILYRPVGTSELELIKESGYTAFPPRLPEQPIFYPVLNEEYASEIAEKWNTKTKDGRGYVTRFSVDDDYIQQFEVHTVGSHIHKELWIPAEELPTFNRNITGRIEVIKEFSSETAYKKRVIPSDTDEPSCEAENEQTACDEDVITVSKRTIDKNRNAYEELGK